MAINFFAVGFVIGLIIFFSICSWLTRRRCRNQYRNVFVPPRNFVTPIQPRNPQFQTIPLSGPIPFQNRHLVKPMPVPQPFRPNITVTSPSSVHLNPLPVHQPFRPTPITNPSSPPDPPADLMERMRQVQISMIEIHRLESEPGEQNSQRVQELKQRVMELNDIDGRDPVNLPTFTSPDPNQPPPAYVPRVDNSERPEYGDASG